MTPLERARFAAIVERKLGLRIDEDRAPVAADALSRRATARGESRNRYLERLEADAADPDEPAQLARELTVGETYFFRHLEQLSAFVEHALPARATARGDGPISVLSAGCSTGEEAYTLAMLVRERAPHLTARVKLHGVDINPAAVVRARTGRYAPWSLRAMPPDSLLRWLRDDGRDHVISPQLREAVQFSEGNLAVDGALLAAGRWDIIFCRNAIMYLTPARAHETIARLVAALAPGGFLFLGHAESIRDRTDVVLCASHGAFYYQRAGAAGAGADGGPAAYFPAAVAAAQRARTPTDAATPRPQRRSDPMAAEEAAVMEAIRGLLVAERYADAVGALEMLPEKLSASSEALQLRAVALTYASGGLLAEAACRALVDRAPLEAGGHYLLALCRDAGGDLDGAIRNARRALEVDPTFAMASVELGMLARRVGDRDAASRELARAVPLLERDDAARLALFGGGFGRRALLGLCRIEATPDATPQAAPDAAPDAAPREPLGGPR